MKKNKKKANYCYDCGYIIMNKKNLFTMWSERKGYKNKSHAYGFFGGGR